MDFPSNTHKDKESRPKVPEKKIEKIVKNEVVSRKRPFGTRFKEVFIGGEGKAAFHYIVIEVLLPSLRNMVVDATTKGIERVIYGDSAPRRSYGNQNTRVSYNSPVRRYNSQQPQDRQSSYRHQSQRHETVELIFKTNSEAEDVLESMLDIVSTYEMASVADLKELAGLPSSHVDNKWGWGNLAGVRVQQIRDGFIIDFPPVEPI